MALNSPLWKTEVLTCNSLSHLSLSGWGWLASPEPDKTLCRNKWQRDNQRAGHELKQPSNLSPERLLIVLIDSLRLLQSLATVPKSKLSSLLGKLTLFVLLVPNSSLPWLFLLHFTSLGQTLAVQERKCSLVAEEGWLWPFLLAVYNSCRAVCWSAWQAVLPFSTVWDWVIRDEAPVCGWKLVMLCSETEGDSMQRNR